MIPAPVNIHVGLMKTATTTLQKRVFPVHEELHYLGGPAYQDEVVRQAIAAICKQDRLRYDQDYHQRQIRSVLNNAANQDKPVLLSDESLTTPTVDRLTKVERLIRLFGDIKIILCLRRPEDFMVSFYSESIKQLNPRISRVPTLDDWLENQWSPQRATRATRFLEYSRLIRCYQELVGEKNVCVLLFEDLLNDQASYARQLSEFIGINSQRTLELLHTEKANTRVNQLDYASIKVSNLLGNKGGVLHIGRFIPRPVKEIIKRSMSGKKQFSMSDEWRKRIRDYCREENSDLCNIIGTGPDRYDYY